MSLIIACNENAPLMPGHADGFFRYHSREETTVDESGHVESPVGHFALLRVHRDTIAKYVSEHGDPWASHTRNLSPGWYMLHTGEDGSVWAFEYGGWCTEHGAFCTDTGAEEQARRAYAEAEEVYGDWAAYD